MNDTSGCDDNHAPWYDIAVVGGGVVGLAILRAATLQGFRCVLVEREPDLISWASGSNSGIVCTGVDSAPGSLERALIRDSISQIRIFCNQMNIPTRQCGSLVCQWEWDNENRLDEILSHSHMAGDTHDNLLSKEDVEELEPNLLKSCGGAVHIQGEIVLDPWLYSIALAVHARQNGSTIYTNFEVDFQNSSFDESIWTIIRQDLNDPDLHQTPSIVKAKALVNATGNWSEISWKHLFNDIPFKVRPRRGQYRVYRSSQHTSITHPIQPVPSQFSKGIFLFSTIHNQLVIGPTAVDQESLTDRSVDNDVSCNLDQIAQRILPGLDIEKDHIGDYVGIRPGTNERDYQIHVKYDSRFITCAGIRSTGLTASLGIGQYISRVLIQTRILEKPQPLKEIRTRPLPTLDELISLYGASDSETVVLDGYKYKVTHPLTKYGLGSYERCDVSV